MTRRTPLHSAQSARPFVSMAGDHMHLLCVTNKDASYSSLEIYSARTQIPQMQLLAHASSQTQQRVRLRAGCCPLLPAQKVHQSCVTDLMCPYHCEGHDAERVGSATEMTCTLLAVQALKDVHRYRNDARLFQAMYRALQY